MRAIHKPLMFLLFSLGLVLPNFGVESDDGSVVLTVMPFQSNGEAKTLNLGDSFSETITTKLIGVRGLKVFERAQFDKLSKELKLQKDSSDLFDESTVSKASSITAIDYMVLGSVTLVGQDLGISIRLIRVRDGQAVLSKQFKTLYPKGIFELQEDMALNLVDTLEIKLNDLERKKISRKPAQSIDSWNLYNKSLGNLPAQERVKLLEKAIEGDRTFIQAINLLADTYIELKQPKKAIEAYASILKEDATDYRAQYNSALLLFDVGDIKAARQFIEKCLALKDHDPDIYYHKGLFDEFDDQGNRLTANANLNSAFKNYLIATLIDPKHREAQLSLGMLSIVVAQSNEKIQDQLYYLKVSAKALETYKSLAGNADSLTDVDGTLEQILPAISEIESYLKKGSK